MFSDTKFTIRPTSINGTSIVIQADSIHKAIERFARTIGLTASNELPKRDANGIEFIPFEIGTGKSFIAFATHDDY